MTAETGVHTDAVRRDSPPIPNPLGSVRCVDTSVKLWTCGRGRGSRGGACPATNHSERINSHCQSHRAPQTKQTEQKRNPDQRAVENTAPHQETNSAFPWGWKTQKSVWKAALAPLALQPPFSQCPRKYSLLCILLFPVYQSPHLLKFHVLEELRNDTWFLPCVC